MKERSKVLKKVLIITLGAILVFAGSIGIASAAKDKPVYATVVGVQQWISEAVSPLQTAIDSLGQRLTVAETAITGSDSEIQGLNTRITALEDNQSESEPLPDFSSNIIESVICQNPNVSDIEDQWRFKIKFDNTLNGQTFRSSGTTIWAIFHLPSGDVIGEGWLDSLYRGVISSAQMPSVGSTVNADVYTFFAGKTVHQNIDIINWIGLCPEYY